MDTLEASGGLRPSRRLGGQSRARLQLSALVWLQRQGQSARRNDNATKLN